MTDCIASANQQSQNPWVSQSSQISQFLKNSPNSWKKKRPNSQKCSNSQKKGQKEDSCPLTPTPIYKLSMIPVVWTISIGQLGLAVWLCSLSAPAQLLISWIWETEISLWFLSNNSKHQCYQHSLSQQLLGGKLTIPIKSRTVLKKHFSHPKCKTIQHHRAKLEYVATTNATKVCFVSSKWLLSFGNPSLFFLATTKNKHMYSGELHSTRMITQIYPPKVLSIW